MSTNMPGLGYFRLLLYSMGLSDVLELNNPFMHEFTPNQ